MNNLKNEDFNLEKETWHVIDCFFKDNYKYLTKHHLDSYNDFIDNKIVSIIKNTNPLKNFKEKLETGEYKYKVEIFIGGLSGENITIGKPIIYSENTKKQLYPNEARLKNYTYSTDIYADLLIRYSIMSDDGKINISEEHINSIKIGRIPIMLHSKYCILNNKPHKLLRTMGECPYDNGGYFIINGKEKIIVSQEKASSNNLYINEINHDQYKYFAEIKSYSDDGFKAIKTTTIKLLHNGIIVVEIPSIKIPVPLFILFRAFGTISDKDICNLITIDNNEYLKNEMLSLLAPSMYNVGPIYNQDDALNFLEKFTRLKSIYQTYSILQNDVFPHIGKEFINKSYYLGYVINKLLQVKLGIIKKTDKDSFINKRLELSGFLLSGLFRELFDKFRKNIYGKIDEIYNYNKATYENDNFTLLVRNNLNKIFNYNIIENGFTKAFKGTWGTKNSDDKQGMVQDINRISNLGSISHSRRSNLPISRSSKIVEPRRLHSSTWGKICPVDTPDGANVGLHKSLSIFTRISFGCKSKPIIDLLSNNELIQVKNINPIEIYKYTKIFVNGNLCGFHTNPESLINLLRLYKRNGLINILTSISWNISNNEIIIRTDPGRCMRPLYVVENNNLLVNNEYIVKIKNNKLRWSDLIYGSITEESHRKNIYYSDCIDSKLLNNGDYSLVDYLKKNQSIIEYVDTSEENEIMIAMNQNCLNDKKHIYSYCEIHPSSILGPLALSIPFSDHNQSPRNAFSCAQTKQAVGLYTTNFQNRMDTFANVLYYPQKPLIKTRYSKYINNDILPSGMNVIVAIASYSGYNQEDSIIINKSAVARGLFNSSYYRSYDTTEMLEDNLTTNEQICNPIKQSNVINIKSSTNYTKLDDYGLIREGTKLDGGDVVIGKICHIGNGDFIDDSVTIKRTDVGKVDKVFCFEDNNIKTAKVRIKSERTPVLGDKFGSRHGQKGVIGMLFNQEDMPYTKDGIVPDIIINPHAIPSRMTIGQLIECILGKECCMLGLEGDATPFTDFSLNNIRNVLDDCGYEKNGNEVLYNGRTGIQLEVDIFIGPTYYQRFKHMVKDKVHSRSTGPNTGLTRQPAGGRARDGGLRIGEMERDAVLAHGTTLFLRESLMERSDKFHVYVCNHNGLISSVNPSRNVYKSEGVNNSMNFSKVYLPYAMKLFIQEMNAFGIAMRLITGTQERFKMHSDLKKIILNRTNKFKKHYSLKNDKILIENNNQKGGSYKYPDNNNDDNYNYPDDCNDDNYNNYNDVDNNDVNNNNNDVNNNDVNSNDVDNNDLDNNDVDNNDLDNNDVDNNDNNNNDLDNNNNNNNDLDNNNNNNDDNNNDDNNNNNNDNNNDDNNSTIHTEVSENIYDNQSGNESANQAVNQSGNQSGNESVNQPINNTQQPLNNNNNNESKKKSENEQGINTQLTSNNCNDNESENESANQSVNNTQQPSNNNNNNESENEPGNDTKSNTPKQEESKGFIKTILDKINPFSSNEVSTSDVSTSDVSTSEVSINGVSTNQVNTSEVNISEVNTNEVNTRDVNTSEVNTSEVNIDNSQLGGTRKVITPFSSDISGLNNKNYNNIENEYNTIDDKDIINVIKLDETGNNNLDGFNNNSKIEIQNFTNNNSLDLNIVDLNNLENNNLNIVNLDQDNDDNIKVIKIT